MQAKYSVYEFGAMETWRDHVGGRIPTRGRKMIEQDLPLDFFGVSINARKPGEEAGYWHAHSVLEELYLFLEGEGEFALDNEVVQVHPGTAVRVGQGVLRTWRCRPDSPTELRWICIRAGGGKLAEIPRDAAPITDKPAPWATTADHRA